MLCCRNVCVALSIFLLTGLCSAQTVTIQGLELPFTLVDGKQMVSRKALAQVFPSLDPGQGLIDLAELLTVPNARILRRNGLIVSVRYQDAAMAAIFGDSKRDSEPLAAAGVTAVDSPREKASSGGFFRSIMDEIVRLSNIERQNQGVPPLASDPRLEGAATAHSEEMARLTYFSHTSPTPGRESPHQRIMQSVPGARATAENIASFTSYPEATLAEEAVKGWMNSPGHRRNLLDPNYTHIGIGVSRKGEKYYLTQNFCAY